MGAPKGNQFWKLVVNPTGRPREFKTPKELWKRAAEYFQWCDNNPLYESKAFNGKDEVRVVSLPKMRAYTLKHLCLHLGVNEKYFNQFNKEDHKEFSNVIERIRDIIYTQKFQGAAADLLNQNIIARDLGLKERTDLTTNDKEVNAVFAKDIMNVPTDDSIKEDSGADQAN